MCFADGRFFLFSASDSLLIHYHSRVSSSVFEVFTDSRTVRTTASAAVKMMAWLS